MLKKIILFVALTIGCVFQLAAQEDSATFMRSYGKIYVVVGVFIIILIGLFAYLYRLDKRISDLEDTNHK